MKKLLSILSICLVFVSCSPDRVLLVQLTNKGTEESPTMYFESKLFTGVCFDAYEDGQLAYEYRYKDGKNDGLCQRWNADGQLAYEGNCKDGEMDGLSRGWYEDGKLRYKSNFKDNELDGLSQGWYENGLLKFELNFKDGVEIN